MSSGRVQLAAVGIKSQDLIGTPDVSFFVKKFSKYEKFAIETLDVKFDQTIIDFGSLLTCTIPRNGHLIKNLHLNLTLPELTQTRTGSNVSVSDRSNIYTDSIGHAIIDYVDLVIGGYTIERITGEYLHIVSQTSIDSSKQDTMNRLVGDTSAVPLITSNLVGEPYSYPRYEYHFNTYEYNPYIVYGLKTASSPLQLKVPLMFYFTQSSTLAIPLAAITRQEVEIRIQFRTLDKLLAGGKVWNWNTPRPLSQLRASLSVEYVFLGPDELRVIKQTPVDYIITQSQVSEISVAAESLPITSASHTYFAGTPFVLPANFPNNTGEVTAAYSTVDQINQYTVININKLDTDSQSHLTWLRSINNGYIKLSSGQDYAQYQVSNKGTELTSYYKFNTMYSTSNSPSSNLAMLFGSSEINLTYITDYNGYYQNSVYIIPSSVIVAPGKFKMGASSGSTNRMDGYTEIVISNFDINSQDQSTIYSNIINGFLELYTNPNTYVRYAVNGSATLGSDSYSMTIQYSDGRGNVALPVYNFFGYSGLQVRYVSAVQSKYKQNGSNLITRNISTQTGKFEFGYISTNQISLYNTVALNNRDIQGSDATDWIQATPTNWIEFRQNNKFALYYVYSYTVNSIPVIGNVYTLSLGYKDSNYPGSNALTLFSTNDVSVQYYKSETSVINPVNMRLNFINPVKELFFLIQDDLVVNQNNDYFNFYNNSAEYFLGDQLDKLELVFNDETFLSSAVASKVYLGDVQFMNNHTRRPNANMRIYNYSFALDPESVLPTGQVNFSRIINQNLKIWLTNSYNSKTGLYSNRTVRVHARSYNILRLHDGIVGLLFA